MNGNKGKMIPFNRKLGETKFEIILLFLKMIFIDFKCNSSDVWLLWTFMEFIWSWKIVNNILGIFLNILAYNMAM